MTRGERNNNPGNIERSSTKWQGMAQDQSSDSRFLIFTDPVWGIRAIGKILLTYYLMYDLNTVSKIVNRWAPPGENNTVSYIKNVCRALGVEADDKIDVTLPTTLKALTAAIIRHENGKNIYKNDLITNGILKALA